MKKRVAIVGAGLCGSLLAALLRDQFAVTVIEQGPKKKPLFDDVDCATGELNTSINRAEGLGGTTNYWHNALIELDDHDLGKAGIEPRGFASYYQQAWSFFLSPNELAECNRAWAANRATVERGASTVAHMVLPQARHNAWQLANARYPGAPIEVRYGHVDRIVAGADGGPAQIEVRGKGGVQRVVADHVLVCAGGIGTPILLARSLGRDDGMVPGYHDHPMAYVAKVRLRPTAGSSGVEHRDAVADVRAGLVYTNDDLKTVVYLRPAVDMRLGSISGPARYILSDLRNDPFSPRRSSCCSATSRRCARRCCSRPAPASAASTTRCSSSASRPRCPPAACAWPRQAAVAQLGRHARPSWLVRPAWASSSPSTPTTSSSAGHPVRAGSSATPLTTRAPRTSFVPARRHQPRLLRRHRPAGDLRLRRLAPARRRHRQQRPHAGRADLPPGRAPARQARRRAAPPASRRGGTATHPDHRSRGRAR
jgi:hypothetical protein